jgi:A/G-specific adenine glycosylase
MATVNNSKAGMLAPVLLGWFTDNARDLPWRRTRDPYAIWVSEIMLQQTQVKMVLPYWKRWMRELPTIESLAGASAAEIHKLWEGLGYYNRVRHMQKAAQIIVERHGGKFPAAFDEVLALPGIGRYTAGAICSIAFNQPTPILDGNVIRVLTRIFGIAENPHEKETNALLWSVAEDLVTCARRGWGETPGEPAREDARPTNGCSHLNQSLMELGALICTPRQPKCAACPVARHCVALRQHCVEQLPKLDRRIAPSPRRFVAFVVKHQGRFLVRQRPAGALNAHLWEFPNVELFEKTALVEAVRRALGFAPRSLKPLCVIKHSITRYRITLETFAANGIRKASLARADGRWLTLGGLETLSFPSAHRRILLRLRDNSAH